MGTKEKKDMPFCGDLDYAIRSALEARTEPTDPSIVKLVEEATTEVPVDTIAERVRHETYTDILGAPDLRELFAIRNADMTRLAGVGPKTVRIFSGTASDSWQGDEIDMVMALACTNVELYLSELAECADMATSSPVGHLLKPKHGRCIGEHGSEAGFQTLCEVADIPDVGEAVLTHQVTTEDVLRLRESPSGVSFRKWFHENCRGAPLSVAREYTALLRHVPKVSSLPSRVLRFIATQLLGLIPGVGGVASGVDSFFIDRMLRGNCPKFFIEDLRQLFGRPRENP